MGDPRKIRKKYATPSHPWERLRIEDERILKKDYGLKNKKEIWKITSKIKQINAQVKKIIRQRTAQSAIEEKQLLDKLYNVGIIEKDSKLEDVLGLDVKRLLDRRLQSVVCKQKLASGIKQARQFIIHGHILVGSKKITIPSYIVLRDEEDKINYVEGSTLFNPEHPERKIIEKDKNKNKIKEESNVQKEELPKKIIKETNKKFKQEESKAQKVIKEMQDKVIKDEK